MPVEISEKELADLREKASRTDSHEKALAEAKASFDKASKEAAARDAELQKIAQELQDPNVVRELAKRSGLNVTDSQAPAKIPDEDPDALISRADLKRATDEIALRAERSAAEHTAVALRGQRASNERETAARLEDYDDFRQAINEYLDKLDPRIAAAPNAQEEVYFYLRGKRDEERRRKRLIEEANSDESREPSESGDEVSRRILADESRTTPSEARREPPVVGSQSTARLGGGRKPSLPKLSEEEEYRRSRMGISVEDWVTYRDGQPESDFMGMKGRAKV